MFVSSDEECLSEGCLWFCWIILEQLVLGVRRLASSPTDSPALPNLSASSNLSFVGASALRLVQIAWLILSSNSGRPLANPPPLSLPGPLPRLLVHVPALPLLAPLPLPLLLVAGHLPLGRLRGLLGPRQLPRFLRAEVFHAVRQVAGAVAARLALLVDAVADPVARGPVVADEEVVDELAGRRRWTSLPTRSGCTVSSAGRP